MKLKNPFFLCFCLTLAFYCHKKDANIDSKEPFIGKEYKLIVDRGAIHYDKFVMSSNKIEYLPDSGNQFENEKYHRYSETSLDSTATISFFQEIENKGFWNLKNRYPAYNSCTSELRITLSVNEKTKTVICDDYNTYCHELIKYIDQKVVEFEGNDLKRIYLPG